MLNSTLCKLPSSLIDYLTSDLLLGSPRFASSVCKSSCACRSPYPGLVFKRLHHQKVPRRTLNPVHVQKRFESMSQKKAPPIPKPSASVVVISPTNQILLLHRVRTSSSFPSAHVFPGGNVSAFHDGEAPPPEDPKRHVDSEVYRLAAVRETFEESGILLAYNNGFGRLLEVPDDQREEGRKAIHKSEVPFTKWLSQKGGRPDIENLIPFTRWITPAGVPKRFTTQMYLYFLPLASSVYDKIPVSSSKQTLIPTPTHDGGIEHTAAQFLPAEKWLEMARSGEIILFPPQFFILTMVSQFLKPTRPNELTPDILEQQRKQLKAFARGNDPPWADVCISPQALIGRIGDGRTVLSLESPGEGLDKKYGRRGLKEYVVVVQFSKEGPRKVQIKTRKEMLQDLKDDVQATGTAYSHHLQHLQTKKGEKL